MSTSVTNVTDSKSLIELRHDWYQTQSNVVINFYIKGVSSETVKLEFQEKLFKIELILPESKFYNKVLKTFQKIVPDDSSYKILSTKIEVKLKKEECYHWTTLEASDKEEILYSTKPLTVEMGNQSALTYPSSSSKKQDWDKLEAEITKDEKEEKPEGDTALNQLFQKIYGDGNEEVKRAMNKSFSESGGTCLSTNWKEVGIEKGRVNAPDGMEYKKW